MDTQKSNMNFLDFLDYLEKQKKKLFYKGLFRQIKIELIDAIIILIFILILIKGGF